jgi:amidophosphoribosyltransferase
MGIVGSESGSSHLSLALNVLSELGNRGSDGTGLMASRNNKFHVERWNGKATAIPTQSLHNLQRFAHDPVNLYLGHVRYATTGAVTSDNIHPAVATSSSTARRGESRVAIVMNGEISFTKRWRCEAVNQGIDPSNAQTDSADCAARILSHYKTTKDISAALITFYKEAFPFGGFSILGSLEDAKQTYFFYLRDGLRPLHMAEIGSAYIFASETAHLVRGGIKSKNIISIPPGEIGLCSLSPKHGKIHSNASLPEFQIINIDNELTGTCCKGLCPFELAYLQHYTSLVRDRTIDSIRKEFGRALCQTHPPQQGDMVAPIPRSGISATDGYLMEAGQMGISVQLADAIVRLKNGHPIERSFLGNGKAEISRRLHRKFAVNPEITSKSNHLILIDDSIVRGDVCSFLGTMWQRNGGDKISIRSAWPPIIAPCRAGIDIHAKDLLALRFSTAKQALQDPSGLEKRLSNGLPHEYFGTATNLELCYVRREKICAILSSVLQGEICTGCFDLRYNYIHPGNRHAPPPFLVEYMSRNNIEMPPEEEI